MSTSEMPKVYSVGGDLVIVLPKVSRDSLLKLSKTMSQFEFWNTTEEGDRYWRHVRDTLAFEKPFDSVPDNTNSKDDDSVRHWEWNAIANKVTAIKAYRHLTGASLRDAKNDIESLVPLTCSRRELFVALGGENPSIYFDEV